MSEDGSSRTSFDVKAVLIYDDSGNYFIHGNNEETPQDMFAKMAPLWQMNPAAETVRFVEFTVSVPEICTLPKVRVYPKDER